MPHVNVNDILGKLSELRAVFVLSERALPFIEEIFGFLREVAPLMEEINASMMDSALLMPHATSQLQSISEATRTAATEILDLIDAVMVHSEHYEGALDQALHEVKRVEKLNADSLLMLRESIPDRPDVIDRMAQNAEEASLHLHNLEGSVHARRTVIDEIREQMKRIAMSLQVQDCTTQQIAAVTHLLDNMRARMAQLLERLDRKAGPSSYKPAYDVPKSAAFNPDARYGPSDERQHAADELVGALQKKRGDDTSVQGDDHVSKSAAPVVEPRLVEPGPVEPGPVEPGLVEPNRPGPTHGA